MTTEPVAPPVPPLAALSLSRTTGDRDAARRADDDLLPRLLADPSTRVLVLDGDRGPVADGPVLALDSPAGARASVAALGVDPDAGTVAVYLGLDGPDRTPHVLLAVPRPPAPPTAAPPPQQPDRPAPAGTRWAGLREVGTLLDATGAGLLVGAVALTNWHATHPRCARCGEPTRPATAGWSRRCPACDAEHYPRTDPAVIMAVVDPDDRILLGRQTVWPPRRYSTLAGFVEPGESLETAVRREVLEEAGVTVGRVVYQGSQPWPFPSSLMLGFTAHATTTHVEVDGEEIAHARWWTRTALAEDVASGALLLPPGVSIARRLIEHWFGAPLPDAQEAWR